MPTTRRARSALVSPAAVGLGRAGVGVSMLARPWLMPQLLGVPARARADLGWAVQMLGARELALGIGSVVARRAGDRRAARTWLLAGLVCDLVDAVALAAAVGSGRVRPGPGAGVVAAAAAAVAVQAAELRR